MASGTSNSLGELHAQSDWQLHQVSTFPLSNSFGLPHDAVASPDGRVAVSYYLGEGIEMFTADGPQETVLRDVQVSHVSVLSDGRYVVRDTDNNLTLYTQAWERLNVQFNSLSFDDGGFGGMCVDRDDNIYVGYHEKMKIFRPEGGAPFHEIHCPDYVFLEMCHMNHSRRLVVCDGWESVRVIDDRDEAGTTLHQIMLFGSQNTCIASLKDGSILVAYIMDDLNMELYTKDLIKIRAVLRDFPNVGYLNKLVELPTGEVAAVSDDDFIVFRKI